jgi:hypothetical protein
MSSQAFHRTPGERVQETTAEELFESQTFESSDTTTQESHRLPPCNNSHTIRESFEIGEITTTRDHELEKLNAGQCTPDRPAETREAV